MIALHGVIHGKTIELEQELGLAEGQRVAVDVRVVDEPPAWLERLAGVTVHRDTATPYSNSPVPNTIRPPGTA